MNNTINLSEKVNSQNELSHLTLNMLQLIYSNIDFLIYRFENNDLENEAFLISKLKESSKEIMNSMNKIHKVINQSYSN